MNGTRDRTRTDATASGSDPEPGEDTGERPESGPGTGDGFETSGETGDGPEAGAGTDEGPGPEDAPRGDSPGATGADRTAGSPDPARDPTYEGWWRYPPAAWLGLVTAPVGLAVAGLAVDADPGVTSQLLLFVGTALLAGPALALVLGSLLSFGTVFWGSRRYRGDPDVDWDPSPAVYLVAAFLLSPLLVGGVWFVQRVRHVGPPDFSTWI